MRERARFEHEISALWPVEREQPGGGTPEVLAVETTPARRTVYVRLGAGLPSAVGRSGKTVRVPAETGIYFPESYRAEGEVDLLLYLHGHTFQYPGDGSAVRAMWEEAGGKGKARPFALRSLLNGTGRGMVLVSPTLGPKSQETALSARGGLDRFVEGVLAAIGEADGRKKPGLGRLVLACHSGGGAPMLRLARSGDAAAGRIVECWGFDCLYSGRHRETREKLYTQPRQWLAWAKANRGKKLYVYYGSSTAQEARWLRGQAPNVVVTQTTARGKGGLGAHYWVPAEHWVERIEGLR
jgi:hypothetical protein